MSALWFSQWWKRPVKPTRPARPRRRAKPQLEALEDRCVPSIDMVTNLSGSSAVSGSLPFEVANAASGDTVQFASNLKGGTITLGSTLDINQALTIDGAGSGITVNGGGNRVFQIDAGNTVVISSLTITGGVASGFNSGGGIYNLGSLTLNNSTVTGNHAFDAAGIVNASNATMIMNGDTVSNNTASGAGGGGIANSGTLTIVNCTIAANQAVNGGGISNNGVLKMANSTVASNTVVGGDGGGIINTGAELDLLNTIVFNPNSGAASQNDVHGQLTQAEGDLFGSSVSITGGSDLGGNQFNTNPLLGPLQDNGGPTATLALLPASPALGTGVSTSLITGLSVPTTDQRGDPRPANSIDIGAFQTQGTAPILTPHQRFVQALYTDFLHRPGDLNNPHDAGGWVNLLDHGTPATTVANGVARSPEAMGVDVDGLYQRFLGRAADPAGRAGFVGYLQIGGTLEGVSRIMLASPEYQSHFASDAAFVQSLYQNLLHRTGSNAEVSAWAAVLPQQGRAGVAQGFLLSQELRDWEVGDDYTQLLDRTHPPSAAEVSGWVGTGFDLLTIDALVAGSPEFQLNG
jgi:hypothetical protein